MTDMAWELDDGKTNYTLKDGDRVVLIYKATTYDKVVKAGLIGTIARARCPKTVAKKGSSKYFALVVMDSGDTIHVPHSAIMKIRKEV